MHDTLHGRQAYVPPNELNMYPAYTGFCVMEWWWWWQHQQQQQYDAYLSLMRSMLVSWGKFSGSLEMSFYPPCCSKRHADNNTQITLAALHTNPHTPYRRRGTDKNIRKFAPPPKTLSICARDNIKRRVRRCGTITHHNQREGQRGHDTGEVNQTQTHSTEQS